MMEFDSLRGTILSNRSSYRPCTFPLLLTFRSRRIVGKDHPATHTLQIYFNANELG